MARSPRRLDLGVLGLTEDRRIRVSDLYVARSDAGRAVDALAGQPLLASRPGQPAVDIVYVGPRAYCLHAHGIFRRSLPYIRVSMQSGREGEASAAEVRG